jgi:hypothetical protein
MLIVIRNVITVPEWYGAITARAIIARPKPAEHRRTDNEKKQRQAD